MSYTKRYAPTVCAAGLALLFVYAGVYRAAQAPPGDFANYYTASSLALDRRFDDTRLYEFYWFNQLLRLVFPNTLGSFIPHPPATVLPLLPLVWLDPYRSKVVFIAINVGLLALVAVLFQRISRLEWPVIACLMLLNGTSLWNNFKQGQLYILLLVTIVLGLWLYLRGNHFWSGVFFGLFIPIKYVPVVFVVYFLLRRNWRLVGGAALASAVVVLLGLYFTSLELNVFFLTQILPPHLAGRITNPFTVSFQSYPSLLNRLFVYEPSLNPTPALDFSSARDALKNLLSWTLIALTVFGIRSFAATTQDDRQRTVFAIALLTLLGLVNAPASATYHQVLMMIPMVLLAGLSVERHGKLPVILIGLYAIVHFFPFSALYRFDGEGWLTIVAYAKLFVLTAFFLLCLPRESIRSRAFAATCAAIAAASVVIAVSRPAPVSDSAAWAGYDGLIIRNLSAQGDRLFYERSEPAGFAAFVSGRPSLEPPPPPRTHTHDGIYRLYAAPVRSGIGSNLQVFIQNTRTLATRQITFAEAKNIEPVWSSDDRRVYFLSDRGRGIDCTTIYYIDLDQSMKP